MDVFFICITPVIVIAVAAIIKIISNRVKGRDDLEGLFVFKNRKKD